MSHGRDPRARVERTYATGNPLFVVVVTATARAMGLHVFRTDRARTTPIHVAAIDDATLDRFDARVLDLYRRLDAEVTRFASDFIARDLGVDVEALTT